MPGGCELCVFSCCSQAAAHCALRSRPNLNLLRVHASCQAHRCCGHQQPQRPSLAQPGGSRPRRRQPAAGRFQLCRPAASARRRPNCCARGPCQDCGRRHPVHWCVCSTRDIRVRLCLHSCWCLALKAPALARSLAGPGSEKIRLFAIDAPEKAQTCSTDKGRTWECGVASLQALKERVGDRPVRCEVSERERVHPHVVCRVACSSRARPCVAEGLTNALTRAHRHLVPPGANEGSVWPKRGCVQHCPQPAVCAGRGHGQFFGAERAGCCIPVRRVESAARCHGLGLTCALLSGQANAGRRAPSSQACLLPHTIAPYQGLMVRPTF